MEALAEDGNNGPIMDEFALAEGGLWDATVSPMNPLCPGDKASLGFEVLIDPSKEYYFSYASMVLPSNDAFIANGNPEAHQLFEVGGNFVDVDFVVAGSEVLDAGSEVNDEIPETTAFLAQTMPNTGDDENGVVEIHPGFIPNGNILSNPEFTNGNFKADGYNTLKFTIVPEGEELEEDDDDGNGNLPVGERGFIVLNINQSNGPWCLSATDTRENGDLQLRQCDFYHKPNYQLWLFDSHQRFRARTGGYNRCMRVGLGSTPNTIFDGVRVHLGDCWDEYVNFDYDPSTGYLMLDPTDDGLRGEYCITNRGSNANSGDSIHAKVCPSNVLDDYQWEYRLIH